jgi:hypothetical protein
MEIRAVGVEFQADKRADMTKITLPTRLETFDVSVGEVQGGGGKLIYSNKILNVCCIHEHAVTRWLRRAAYVEIRTKDSRHADLLRMVCWDIGPCDEIYYNRICEKVCYRDKI